MRANQPFVCLVFFLYTTSEEKEHYEALFLSYRPLKNAVFHKFSRQIAFIQYSGPSKHAWTYSETVQKISKITYTASWFSLLTSAKFAWILIELRFNVIEYLLSSIFDNGFISMCNLKKFLIRSSFWVILQAMFMHGWKQTENRWKLHFWDI